MSRLSDDQIITYISNLLDFVDGLPVRDRGKAYLRSKILVDFLDTWQFDDEANSFTFDEYVADSSNPRFVDVQSTYGIRNTSQIERYTKSFIKALKKTRTMALQSRLKKLDRLHPAIKAERLSKTLAKVSRSELFAKYGFEEVKDPEWNNELKEILGAEFTFSKEQAELLTMTPNPHLLPKAKDDEILIVEEIENQLAIEAVNIIHKYTVPWQNLKIDPGYFDSFVSGPLFDEFIKYVYEHMRCLNNQEINQFFSLSLQQFKTHTPAKRHKAFLIKYYDSFWYPNKKEYKEEEYMVRYATRVWKHYTNHFNLFRDAFQKIYDDYKISLGGTHPFTIAADSKPSLDSPVKSLDDVASPEKQKYVMDLLEDLSITKDGTFVLGERKKGAIRGVVESLRENSILPNTSLHILCKIIGEKVGLEIKSKLEFSDISQDYLKKANKYVKDSPFH